jgi:hypothetical protein
MRATIDGPATGMHSGIGVGGTRSPDAAPRHAGRDPTIPMGHPDERRRPATQACTPALYLIPRPNPIRVTTPFHFLSFSISDPT